LVVAAIDAEERRYTQRVNKQRARHFMKNQNEDFLPYIADSGKWPIFRKLTKVYSTFSV
jgi:hypothetical protein